MKRIILVLFILLTFIIVGIDTSPPLNAQGLKLPQVSQKASVSQTIGLTEVTVNYHRPGVKNRVIWGKLVPFDQIWRAGANEATTIEFSTPVKVEGKELAAGTYSLFLKPMKGMATVIFSKQTGLWGTTGYKEEMDALRVDIPVTEAAPAEWLIYYFDDLTDSSGSLVLRWEKVMAKIKIEVDTQSMILNNAKRSFARYWVEPYQAANYAFGKKLYKKALEWLDVSISIENTFWNLQLKAKILKTSAKTKKEHKTAMKVLEKAIVLGSKLNQNLQDNYVSKARELLKEWKTKK